MDAFLQLYRKSRPDDPRIHVNLGTLLIQQSRYADAEQSLAFEGALQQVLERDFAHKLDRRERRFLLGLTRSLLDNGGEVHEVGITLLMLTPVPFVNVNETGMGLPAR